MQLLRSDSHPRMRSLPDPTTDRWTSHLSFSVSGLAGDIPSTPTLETSCAGCAAQAVQSVVWVNISELASTNFSQVGGQQELTDLLGGLLLNSSGNVTGSLRPVTSELPTLGLSRQVMGALANVALPNDGGYPAPPANAQAPPKEEQWWQVPGTVLWNAVSGVVGLVSVAWDATAAAAEYLANAAGVLLTDLGITALVDQAVAALKTVASAMEAALQALMAALIAAAKAAFNLLIKPIEDAIVNYAIGISTSMNAYLNSVSALASGTGSVDQVFQALANLFLSFLGLLSFAGPVTNTLTTIMDALNPILSLFDPLTLVQDFLSAIHLSSSLSSLKEVMGQVSAFALNAISAALFQIISGATSVLGFSGVTVSPPNGVNFPSTSDGQSLATAYGQQTGDSGLSNLLNPLFQADSSSSAIDFVDIAFAGAEALLTGIYAWIIVTPAKITIEGGGQVTRQVLDLANLHYGQLVGEGLGFVLSIVGLVLDFMGQTLDALLVAIFAAVTTLFSTIDAKFTHMVFKAKVTLPPPLEYLEIADDSWTVVEPFIIGCQLAGGSCP